MTQDEKPLTFMAELRDEPGTKKRFAYVIDGSAQVSLPNDWWESMGSPQVLQVTVVPDVAEY